MGSIILGMVILRTYNQAYPQKTYTVSIPLVHSYDCNMKTEMGGKKFGRLLVLKEAGRTKYRMVQWECLCECRNIKIVRGACLRNGHTQSCGCYKKDRAKKDSTTHGMYGTSEYHTWNAMLQRCNNPKTDNYQYYGGRGIKVCNRWLKFKNFFKDMGLKPQGLTLERKNSDGNYELDNVCWDTFTKQARNQRIGKNNKTGIKGISWNEKSQKYRVRIMANKKSYEIGSYSNLEQAKIARNQAEQEYWK